MKKYVKYIVAFFTPIIIFFVAASLNGYYPLGDSMFNIYDSAVQYPGIFMMLKNFSFFSFSGGFGFNVFATAAYYLMSPFNLLIFFFNNLNFYIFFTIIIYIKMGLSSLFMCLFLVKENNKNTIWAIFLGAAYALCGFASTYYYNVMWMDGVYLLPLVLLGIKKLVFEDKKLLYLFSLSITIITNFYIGYMICIFSVIYFLYLILTNEKIYFKKIKPFLITSLLATLISCFILVPTAYGLMQGKAAGFGSDYTNYFEINNNVKFFFYTLTPGSYQLNGQSFGPAQIYSSLLSVILVILFFFNSKFSKKEKIVIASIIFFYFISFFWSGLDYAWQLFQKPVWWESRYSFTFSAFLIIIAYKSICNIDTLTISSKQKIITMSSLILLITICFILNYLNVSFYKTMNIAFIVISLFLTVDYFLFLNKLNIRYIVILFLCIELILNSFGNLKKNNLSTNLEYNFKLKEIRFQTIKNLEEYDNSFYRLEFVDKDTSNDGMLYNYNGINYFNSVRNQKLVKFIENYTNIRVSSHCGIILDYFNPYLLSLFNTKYLIDNKIDYYNPVIVSENNTFSIFSNPYPLSIGFMVNENIRKTKLVTNEHDKNLDKIFSSMLGEEIKTYQNIINEFIADEDYLLFKKDTSIYNLVLNEMTIGLNSTFNLIKKGDKIQTDEEIKLLKLSTYEEVMEKLSDNLLTVTKSNHLLEGTINVTEDKKILFLSIPYDEGLKITVDNKEVKPELLLETFIGIELDEGEHKIVIDYVTKGLKLGIALSITGLLLSIVYLSRKEKI